uniref:Uncharacterized protein n=1 Tax=Octopus bimaculoides TaxID=37653 RepID=A0A0L8HRF8_OCTBM
MKNIHDLAAWLAKELPIFSGVLGTRVFLEVKPAPTWSVELPAICADWRAEGCSYRPRVAVE